MEEQRLDPFPTLSVKLVIGLFFALLGVLMTLDNLRLFDANVVLRYWPVVLIVVGVLQFGRERNRALGIVAAAAGVVLLTVSAGWLRVSIFDLWPLLLIGAGVALVVQALRIQPQDSRGRNVWATLASRKVVIDSPDFTGARLVAVLGGCELDLTRADISPSQPAVIEVFAMWGGIEMTVPEGWEVSAEVVPFMGGVEVNTKSKRTGRQLVIRGMVVMGGMEIKNASVRTA